MPKTRNERDLPMVEKEVAELNDLMISKGLQTSITLNPMRETVIKALPDNHIVHFACHGGTNAADPSKSRLQLADLPLTVSDFAALHLPLAQFTFLSACHSASAKNFFTLF
jgi:CHAT domain-containing protein